MTLSSAATGSTILLTQLVTVAVRTIVLAATTGLLMTLFRLRTPAIRLFIWTAVLYLGLSMPILAWLLHPIRIPLLPSPPVAASEFANPGRLVVAIPSSGQIVNPKASARNVSPTANTKAAVRQSISAGSIRTWFAWGSIPWSTLAAALYLAVAVFLLLRIVVGNTLARRLVRSSNPIQQSGVGLGQRFRAPATGRRVEPRIRESSFISVPVTVGAIAPAILLPIHWREWDDAKLDAVITHEMSHVLRRDALSQYLSLIYRAIFWFSPLAWWLNRQITELAEEASDEAALAAGAERTGYARTLIGFFQAAKDSPARIQWQGVSMANADQAEKRLEKILAWKGEHPMRLKRSVITAVIAFAIAAVYFTAAAKPVVHAQSSPVTTSSTPGPASPPASGTPGEPQAPASAPAAPSEPPARAESQPSSSNTYEFDDEQRFVIVSGKSEGVTMSGTSEDARHAQNLRKRISGDFIWFERDEKSYIIRDQATVDRAHQLWAPQQELGRKQEELGKQQETLGKQQEELGARMQQIRVKVPDMTGELDKLKAELHDLGPDASMEQIGRIQSQMGELQAKIGELQAHAGDEQGKLGEEMGALGEKQGKLGEQQGALGQQQAELGQKASRAMKQLLDDAIQKGLAQPEPEAPGSASL